MADIETERRNRIRLSLAAYAYEFASDPIMTDAEFDSLALKINKEVKTGNEILDNFFINVFEPHTGQWIHNHPELDKLKNLYQRYKKGFKK